MTIIIIYGHQSDQVYVNCCQTKTPAVTLTTQSRFRMGKNRSSVGTSSFRYNHIYIQKPSLGLKYWYVQNSLELSLPSVKTKVYIYCRHYTRKLQKVPSLFLGKLNVILVECHCFIFMQLHLAQSFPHWLKMEHFSKQSQCLDSSTVLHN